MAPEERYPRVAPPGAPLAVPRAHAEKTIVVNATGAGLRATSHVLATFFAVGAAAMTWSHGDANFWSALVVGVAMGLPTGLLSAVHGVTEARRVVLGERLQIGRENIEWRHVIGVESTTANGRFVRVTWLAGDRLRLATLGFGETLLSPDDARAADAAEAEIRARSLAASRGAGGDVERRSRAAGYGLWDAARAVARFFWAAPIAIVVSGFAPAAVGVPLAMFLSWTAIVASSYRGRTVA